MTALAGGVLLVKGITGGALFGGPFGAVVGAIGAGLMAAGMLVVGFFSDNDYQTFVRHCFLGEDHGESVTPEWSTVSFGSGSLSSEVAALYDLLYRYKVSFVKTAKVTPGLPHDTTKWSGLKLTIDQGYGTGKDEKYHIDLKLRHHSRYVTGTFTVKNLVLPDKISATGTGGKAHTPYIVRRWSPGEVVDEMIREGNAKATSTQVLDNLYLYSGDFSVSVQLSVNGRLTGKPTRIKGETGGKETLGLIDMGWKHVDFE
jgi:hypothetical protein